MVLVETAAEFALVIPGFALLPAGVSERHIHSLLDSGQYGIYF